MEIYTDGSSVPNPGRGGWGWLIKHPKKEYTGYGYEAWTTNNRMEMVAVIEAIKFAEQHELIGNDKLTIYSDSQYVVKGASVWMEGWVKRNFYKSTREKTEVKNKDLWVIILMYINKYDIEWCWIKGHNGHRENEICDTLAELGRSERRGCRGL
jgi:ribonuclease HI